jgi:hypothetical protein
VLCFQSLDGGAAFNLIQPADGFDTGELLLIAGDALLPLLSLPIQRFQPIRRGAADQLLAQLMQLLRARSARQQSFGLLTQLGL